MFRIIIEELNGDAPAVQRYVQVVDAINLPLVQKAVNTKPRKKRERKQGGEQPK